MIKLWLQNYQDYVFVGKNKYLRLSPIFVVYQTSYLEFDSLESVGIFARMTHHGSYLFPLMGTLCSVHSYTTTVSRSSSVI